MVLIYIDKIDIDLYYLVFQQLNNYQTVFFFPKSCLPKCTVDVRFAFHNDVYISIYSDKLHFVMCPG